MRAKVTILKLVTGIRSRLFGNHKWSVLVFKLSLFKSRPARRILLLKCRLSFFLIISWENYDFKVDGFKNYYYSLLIDATTETHSSRSVNYDSVEDQPWLKVSMQSVVGLGSNLSIPDGINQYPSMLKDIANQITVIELGNLLLVSI